jgi:2-polyprenyl-3-methyl-5-hydroxy-6-metoxy-1,4-benzoquinol methylase
LQKVSEIQTVLSEAEAAQRDEFVERILNSTAGVFDIFTIHIGHQLGLYKALSANGYLTPPELANQTGTEERYVREWLEQQTVADILEVENPEAGAKDRRFRLPPARAEVLVDQDSLNYLAPLAQLAVGATQPVTSVVEAFRNGGGVPYGDYGANLREGQAGINRATFLQELPGQWLPAIPELQERLDSGELVRVADIGMGAGWSSIGMALEYDNIHVDGYDLDEPSVALARENARLAGLNGQVRFYARDAGDPEITGEYDLVTAFEAIHDMSDPVSALRTMRRLVAGDGTVLVVDERVGEQFTPEGNDVEWMMYGWSVLHCLPVGMADQPSVGTGTVLRPETLRGYAIEAGFSEIEVLPIDNFFFRVYRLIP